MNFIVEKENRKVNVTREFSAPLKKVWAAWTESDILDQWWAPRPWKARTSKMDFREGGHWLYAMVGPEGEEHWCRVDFLSVSEHRSFKGSDYFCDAEGNINKDLPVSVWTCRFSESGNSTLVDIEIDYESTEDLEKIIEMGFKEGFTMALGNLDEVINSL